MIDIITNSPGDKAGFKTGDIIFSIDNVFSNNIQLFKTTLQNAGSKIKILVLRDGKPLVLTMQVKSILRR